MSGCLLAICGDYSWLNGGIGSWYEKEFARKRFYYAILEQNGRRRAGESKWGRISSVTVTHRNS